MLGAVSLGVEEEVGRRLVTGECWEEREDSQSVYEYVMLITRTKENNNLRGMLSLPLPAAPLTWLLAILLYQPPTTTQDSSLTTFKTKDLRNYLCFNSLMC